MLIYCINNVFEMENDLPGLIDKRRAAEKVLVCFFVTFLSLFSGKMKFIGLENNDFNVRP